MVPAPDDFPAARVPEPRTILVVDDDPMLLRMTDIVLRDGGYRVIMATDGASALRAIERDAGAIDLVILDRRMPGMDGLEVLERIRRRGSDMRVLLVTGYAPESATDDASADGVTALLQKPYDPQDLLSAVRAIICA
jgi:CheY-like chemotaxis protein